MNNFLQDTNPRPTISHDQQSTGVMRVILLVIIVALAAALGTYFWQQQRIANLNDEITTLQAKSTATKNEQPDASQPSGTTAAIKPTYTSQKGVKIVVYAPSTGAAISSPLAVVGEVPGSWSFEASFPITLEDKSGKVVATGTAQILGDWMTDKLVPFSAKLAFSDAVSGTGTLVIASDNPSGEVRNDDEVRIAVRL
jgi:hypothetical protein